MSGAAQERSRQPDQQPQQPADQQADQRAEAERRRRRSRVFGDVLPESTGDDRDPGEGAGGGNAAEEWLRRQVPPHHG